MVSGVVLWPYPALSGALWLCSTAAFVSQQWTSHEGHQECPSCLGMAHLREDVDNPCSAACDLSREEQLCRATRVCSSVPERGKEKEHDPDKPGHKRSHKHLCDRRHDFPHRSSQMEGLTTAKHPTPAPPAAQTHNFRF